MKALGVAIAMDDFGAGHTSFRNLRRLGVDIVKIDGAFVQNMSRSLDDRFFVRTLAQLARHLGIQTVAEWVEDDEARRLLAEWGIDYLQGHLVGRPELYEPRRATPRGKRRGSVLLGEAVEPAAHLAELGAQFVEVGALRGGLRLLGFGSRRGAAPAKGANNAQRLIEGGEVLARHLLQRAERGGANGACPNARLAASRIACFSPLNWSIEYSR